MTRKLPSATTIYTSSPCYAKEKRQIGKPRQLKPYMMERNQEERLEVWYAVMGFSWISGVETGGGINEQGESE